MKSWSATTMWSSSRTSTASSAILTRRVAAWSASEGRATPLGWLWARITELAQNVMAFCTILRTSRFTAEALPSPRRRQASSFPFPSRQISYTASFRSREKSSRRYCPTRARVFSASSRSMSSELWRQATVRTSPGKGRSST